jgi:hypothetical protein
MSAPTTTTRTDHDSGRRAHRLVWLLAGLALTAGAVTLVLLWRALHTIELERSRLFVAQTRNMDDISRIEAEVVRGRTDLKTILDPEIVPTGDHAWLHELEKLMLSQDAIEVDGDRARARDTIAALQRTLDDCQQWRRLHEVNRNDLSSTHAGLERASTDLQDSLMAEVDEQVAHIEEVRASMIARSMALAKDHEELSQEALEDAWHYIVSIKL